MLDSCNAHQRTKQITTRKEKNPSVQTQRNHMKSQTAESPGEASGAFPRDYYQTHCTHAPSGAPQGHQSWNGDLWRGRGRHAGVKNRLVWDYTQWIVITRLLYHVHDPTKAVQSYARDSFPHAVSLPCAGERDGFVAAPMPTQQGAGPKPIRIRRTSTREKHRRFPAWILT